jgi:signal peptidase II
LKVLFISFAVVLIDQFSKLLVKGFSIPFLNLNIHGMYEGQSISLLGNFFNITLVENPGIAFGINFGESFKFLIVLFSIIAGIGLVIYLYRNRNKIFSLRLAIALILGGAVGNLFDRIFYGVFYNYGPLFHGRVVDFFNLRFFNFFIFDRLFGSYVFNFADMAVTSGVILLLFALNWQRATESSIDPAMENYLAENKE